MNDLRKAAEMALEALESYPLPFQTYAKEALRQALATQDTMQVTMQVTTQMAKRKTLVELLDSTPVDAVNMSEECVHKSDKLEQEPWPSVQCVCGGAIYFKYTPREWVGLTDADIAQTMHGSVEGSNMLPYQFARAIEQALKEKNT